MGWIACDRRRFCAPLMMQASAIARSHSSRFGSAVAIALLLLIDAAAAAPETLTVDGRKLLMDGKPWVMRGVTYAPTPVGNDPGWGRGSTADYHSTDYSDIHARDIDLLEEMGVNTIRVYDVGDSEEGQHEFWERLDNSNISVMAGIELHVPTGGGWGEWWKEPGYMMIADSEIKERIKNDIRHLLRTHNHSSIKVWAIGNEMNGVWNNWLGPAGGQECPSQFKCLFGDDIALLYQAVDDLCSVVKHEARAAPVPPPAAARPPARPPARPTAPAPPFSLGSCAPPSSPTCRCPTSSATAT